MTPATLLSLFAQTPPKRTDPFLTKTEDWVVVALMMAVLLAAAVAFWALERWRKKTASVSPDTIGELTDFRGMYERGEITDEEYAKLRDRVATRIKGTPEPPAPPTPHAGQAPATPPPDAPEKNPSPPPPGGGEPPNTPPSA